MSKEKVELKQFLNERSFQRSVESEKWSHGVTNHGVMGVKVKCSSSAQVNQHGDQRMDEISAVGEATDWKENAPRQQCVHKSFKTSCFLAQAQVSTEKAIRRTVPGVEKPNKCTLSWSKAAADQRLVQLRR